MNKHILTTTMAALLAGLPLLQADDKNATSNGPGTVRTGGTVTVTTDINGKKETKIVKIGDDGGGANANAAGTTIVNGANGTVTFTTDINGKKETKTLKIGEGGNGAVLGGLPGEGNVAFGVAGGIGGPAKMVKATWLGVAVNHPLSEELRAQLPLQAGEGISVSHVAPESPAAKAGLEQHDVLSRLDDQVLVSGEQFQTLVKMHKPGDKAKLVYFRKGERKEVEVAFVEHEVEERPAGNFLRVFGGDGADLDQLPDMPHGPGQLRERLEHLKQQGGDLREKLKDMKEKFPGVIIEKRAFTVDPDGKVKVLGNNLGEIKEAVDAVRKQLENANVPKETIDQVRKALDGVIDNAGEVTKKSAKGAINELLEQLEKRGSKDLKKADDLEKKDPAKP
jgi:hypothetical protein